MRHPALDDLIPEQISAIGAAMTRGDGIFESGGITYIITKKGTGYAVAAREDGSGANVGYIMSGLQGQHYSLEVLPEFRGKGIGTLLLQTKEAMDGILSHDWSARYSRILFLIQRGFVPVKKVEVFDDIHDDMTISRDEWRVLIQALRNHVEKHLVGDSTDDVSPVVFRLKYSPGKAREFVKRHQLGPIKN